MSDAGIYEVWIAWNAGRQWRLEERHLRLSEARVDADATQCPWRILWRSQDGAVTVLRLVESSSGWAELEGVGHEWRLPGYAYEEVQLAAEESGR